MPTVQHIVTATENPWQAPPSIGAHFINTETGDAWYAVGIVGLRDWLGPLKYSKPIVLVPATQTTLELDPFSTVIQWAVISDGVARTIVFPFMAEGFFYELDLFLVNPNVGDVTISVDTNAGIPFTEATLSCPAHSTMLYRLACFTNAGKWTSTLIKLVSGPGM